MQGRDRKDTIYLVLSRQRLHTTDLAAFILAMPRLDVDLSVIFQVLG